MITKTDSLFAGPVDIDPLRAPTARLPEIEDAAQAGEFPTASPDEMIEHLKKLEKACQGWIGSRLLRRSARLAR